MNDSTVLERMLRRDRAMVLAGLAGAVLLSWAYLLHGAGMPTMGAGMAEGAMDGMAGGMAAMTWTPAYAVLMAIMWAVMMMAMMLPSAAPMILLFATINRKRRQEGAPYVRTGVFALGYAIVWAGFSVLATALQWGLERNALLAPATAGGGPLFGGVLLMAAGLYQLTPLKQVCLRHCRAPLDFVLHHWRSGPAGALAMGVEHGLYCLGCCWVLMLLLFVGGVMNLLWVAAIAAFVLLEKTAPAGHWLGRAAGLGLVAWGGAMVAASLL